MPKKDKNGNIVVDKEKDVKNEDPEKKEKSEKDKNIPKVQVFIQNEEVPEEKKEKGAKGVKDEKDKQKTFIEESKIKIGDLEYQVNMFASVGKSEKEQKEELDEFLNNVRGESLDDKRLYDMSKEISEFKIGEGLDVDAVVFKNGDDYIVAIKGNVFKRENGEITGIDQEKINDLISRSVEKFKEKELAELNEKSEKKVEEEIKILPDNIKDLENSTDTYKLFPDDEDELQTEKNEFKLLPDDGKVEDVKLSVDDKNNVVDKDNEFKLLPDDEKADEKVDEKAEILKEFEVLSYDGPKDDKNSINAEPAEEIDEKVDEKAEILKEFEVLSYDGPKDEEPKLPKEEQDKFQMQLLDDIEKIEGSLMPDEAEIAPSLAETKELDEISDEHSINA